MGGGALLAVLTLIMGCYSEAKANPIIVGPASGFTVFSFGSDKSIVISGPSAVKGNVGALDAGAIEKSGSTRIRGDLSLGSGGTLHTSGSAGVSGMVFRNADGTLDSVAANMRALSMSAAGVAVTNPLTDITVGQTIVSNGGVNVLDVNNLKPSGSNVLTLTGSAGSSFIINISNEFSLSGSSQIVLAGGLTPNDVLFNVIGSGKEVNFSGSSAVRGIVLSVDRNFSIGPATLTGQVFAQDLNIHSGAQVTGPPPPSAPEPTTMLLWGRASLESWLRFDAAEIGARRSRISNKRNPSYKLFPFIKGPSG